MKGKYINTVILQAALAGNRSRRLAAEKETITTLNDHKIIWTKEGKTATKTNTKSQNALVN